MNEQCRNCLEDDDNTTAIMTIMTKNINLRTNMKIKVQKHKHREGKQLLIIMIIILPIEILKIVYLQDVVYMQ